MMLFRHRISAMGSKLLDAPYHGLWWLLAVSCMAIIFALIAGQRSDVRLQFKAISPTPGSLQIFYSPDGQYSELRSQVWPISANLEANVSVSIATAKVRMLRLDPAVGMTRVTLCDMGFLLSDGKILPIALGQVMGTGQTAVRPDGKCVALESARDASDPQVGVDLASQHAALAREQRVGRVSCLVWGVAGAVGLLAFFLSLRRSHRGLQQGLGRLAHALPQVYLVIALMFGTVFALLTPPGAVPDEPSHIAKVVLVENGHWLGAEGVKGTNPAVSDIQGPFTDFLNPERRFSSQALFAHASTPLPCRLGEEDIPKSAANYSPTLYMPAAFALNVACRTGASIGSFLYGGRMANLVVAVLLTFIGLTCAGPLRWPLFAVALLPMTLFEQASMTADSMILGMSFCLVGLQAGIATGKVRPSLLAELSLLALGLGLALSKPGYAWLCVGFLVSMNAYRTASRPFLRAALTSIALPWIIHVAWVVATVSQAVARAGVVPGANAAAIIEQPFQVIGLVWRTFFGDGSEFIWTSMLGRLGWLDVMLHPASYVLMGTTLILTMFMRNGPLAMGVRQRLLAITFGLGSALLFVIPMYLYWTPASAILVEGLQGRYFIPSAVFVLTWVGMRAPLAARAIMSVFVLMTVVIVQCDAIYSLAYRYYA